MQTLKKGTLLQGGKYRIEQTLGQGGFGITYLAEQPMLERKVCIKEFFFKDYCERDESTSHVTLSTKTNRELVERFRGKFLKEARVISKLHHDHIVQIHDIFEENGTAYYVMDYIKGQSLGDIVKQKGAIDEFQAIGYIKDVASALDYIHSKSINHLDIKPSNIMLRSEDQRILLIDFGVSKQYDEGTFEGTTTTPVGISHGYSPAEQYRKNGVQSFSPQSDVYALAATLYKLLTGSTPPEAIEVQDEGLPLGPLQSRQVSTPTINAIVNAMKSRTQRTQSIAAFVAALSEEVDVTIIPDVKPEPKPQPKPQPKPTPKPTPKKPRKSSKFKKIKIGLYVIGAMFVIIFVLAGIFGSKNKDKNNGSNAELEAKSNQVTDYPIMANDGSVIYIWTGELSDQNLPVGEGVATFAASDKQSRKEYRGEMNNGVMESQHAVLLYTNGSTYEGSFLGGHLSEGTLTLAEEKMYFVGTFQNDQEYNGKWYFIDGDELYSELVNGMETVK